MAWYTQMIPVFRILIDDLDSSEYSDERVQDILAAAATFVTQETELGFDSYTATASPALISPDPTTTTDGQVFSNFVILKAACIIDKSNMRKRALISGIEAKCGPAVMKTLRHSDGLMAMLQEGYCKTYEETKTQYVLGNVDFCRAVLSPFVNEEFDPKDLLITDRQYYNGRQ